MGFTYSITAQSIQMLLGLYNHHCCSVLTTFFLFYIFTMIPASKTLLALFHCVRKLDFAKCQRLSHSFLFATGFSDLSFMAANSSTIEIKLNFPKWRIFFRLQTPREGARPSQNNTLRLASVSAHFRFRYQTHRPAGSQVRGHFRIFYFMMEIHLKYTHTAVNFLFNFQTKRNRKRIIRIFYR